MYGNENMDAASTLFERAETYKYKGDHPAAENLYKQAVKMQQSLHGLHNRYTQKFLKGLTDLYEAWDKPGKSDSLQSYFTSDVNQ